jgi:hypothetical protein
MPADVNSTQIKIKASCHFRGKESQKKVKKRRKK